MSVVEHEVWYDGKIFSTDWTTVHMPTWASTLQDRRHDVVDVLEIGSWEGRSALFWLNYFPRSRLVCIDTFAGSAEHQLAAFAGLVGDIEQKFDWNLKDFAGRFEKFKARSSSALSQLAIKNRRFDFVYIDGSHQAVDAYADAALAWPMVRPGGAMLFDDYTWLGMPDEMDRPKLGIDAFLSAAAGSFRERHRDLQILIEKNPR